MTFVANIFKKCDTFVTNIKQTSDSKYNLVCIVRIFHHKRHTTYLVMSFFHNIYTNCMNFSRILLNPLAKTNQYCFFR